ncbi:MAG: hypothetical protein J0H85_07940 [Sediminibacterium magnilacihabitans]|jgi:hypothetical protein|nr:hypothetical protein [Sediminibacterium magnilacihabitans]PQV60662.1 hypothetical protein CLV53_10698 [Sediminibacterium magnilacihabitans]
MIRTIVTPHQKTISFTIPNDYIGKEIEVIVFAKSEGIIKEQPAKRKVTFDALSIDTRGYKFNRDEANER